MNININAINPVMILNAPLELRVIERMSEAKEWLPRKST
jgi:hypothetical protein